MASHRMGFAKVHLSALRFLDRLEHGDGREQTLPQLNEPNVVRLVSIFRLAGPAREEEHNFIQAIAPTSVQERLSPEFPAAEDVILVDLPLRCLRGRHRAEAASRILAAEDQWWNVEVFDEGPPSLSPEYTLSRIAYSRSFRHSD